MQHARHTGLRRVAVTAVLAAGLGLASLTLSQCTNVGDNLTGVGIDRNGATSCIHECNEIAFAARNLCKKEHETAREECLQLPEGPDRDACEAEAGAERDACNAAANAAKEECRNSCHRQGQGTAG